ncbi:hypothetical protein N3K66_007195 [Trichothecium roseum]|uniref:Uncharacterized protein n=1 Tax=Trichothecium roseum TaxID=47278 RepID=A0ACC0UUY6_9HYPO|nr:hypothetical protein N3K66_007195 [Trichothecium roseum]
MPAPSGVRLRESCQACALSKIKCSKDKPSCNRCSERGTTCRYLITQKTGRKVRRRSVSNQPDASAAAAAAAAAAATATISGVGCGGGGCGAGSNNNHGRCPSEQVAAAVAAAAATTPCLQLSMLPPALASLNDASSLDFPMLEAHFDAIDPNLPLPLPPPTSSSTTTATTTTGTSPHDYLSMLLRPGESSFSSPIESYEHIFNSTETADPSMAGVTSTGPSTPNGVHFFDDVDYFQSHAATATANATAATVLRTAATAAPPPLQPEGTRMALQLMEQLCSREDSPPTAILSTLPFDVELQTGVIIDECKTVTDNVTVMMKCAGSEDGYCLVVVCLLISKVLNGYAKVAHALSSSSRDGGEIGGGGVGIHYQQHQQQHHHSSSNTTISSNSSSSSSSKRRPGSCSSSSTAMTGIGRAGTSSSSSAADGTNVNACWAAATATATAYPGGSSSAAPSSSSPSSSSSSSSSSPTSRDRDHKAMPQLLDHLYQVRAVLDHLGGKIQACQNRDWVFGGGDGGHSSSNSSSSSSLLHNHHNHNHSHSHYHNHHQHHHSSNRLPADHSPTLPAFPFSSTILHQLHQDLQRHLNAISLQVINELKQFWAQ